MAPGIKKKLITPKAAAAWFLHDMAEVSGYVVEGFSEDTMLSIYATYRPMLTAADPWYFAGVVALEACKINDLFEIDEAKEVLREIFEQMDAAVGRTEDNEVSTLAFMIMGRLGMGALLLHRKVPDNLLAKVMMILIGSPSTAAPMMPSPTAHKQLRAALKLGQPVWWKMFTRRYRLRKPQQLVATPKLVPSTFADEEPVLVEQETPAADVPLLVEAEPVSEAEQVPVA